MNTFTGLREDVDWWQPRAADYTGKIPCLVGFKRDLFETGSFLRKRGNDCRWMQSKPAAKDEIQTKTHYTVSFFFLLQLDPTVSMTAIFSHSFPKIDIHFVSVQQLALVVCIARSPARKKRETGKWHTKSTPKKCNIQERFLLALSSFDKLCENQKQLQLNHVASSYVSKLTKLFTLCKGSLIVMNIST